jgi:hypothetical protein
MNAIEHAYGPGDAEITVIAVVRDGRGRGSPSTTRGAGASRAAAPTVGAGR